MDRPPAFADAEVQARLERDGYVHLPGVLGPETVQSLLALYEWCVVRGPEGPPADYFFTTALVRDRATRAEIWDGIVALVREELEPLCAPDMTVASGQFAVNPGAIGGKAPHQDPTVVDEDRFPLVSLWIPLADVGADDGLLSVLPGSHRAHTGYRPLGAETLGPSMLDAYAEGAIEMPMQAGDVLVLDARVVHGSTPNRSGRPRVSVIVGLVHDRSTMWFAQDVGPGRCAIYEVDLGFFRTADLLAPDLSSFRCRGEVGWRLAEWPAATA